MDHFAYLIGYAKATKREHFASYLKEVTTLNSALKLLKAQRSSALIDARKMEAQLSRLNKSAEAARTKTYLRYVARMFRDYIRTLDEDIKSARTARRRKNDRLPA
jgi:hypothetical protein